MFPPMAKDGSVLERNGHAEATVDFMRLAGLKECGLYCEIMKDDGTMMGTTDLLQFADEHSTLTLIIKELQDYRKVHDSLIQCRPVIKMPPNTVILKHIAISTETSSCFGYGKPGG